MKLRATPLIGAVLLVLTACGPSGSGSLGPAPTGVPPSPTPGPAGSPGSPGSPTPSASPGKTMTIQVWFTRAGKVFPTRRNKPATLETSRLALTELVAGPSTVESGAGVGNAIPGGTAFDIKGISGGTATVSFPAAFYAGGRDVARLRQAQVVYTLTQFSTVFRVGFQSGGDPAGWPVGRADYADLIPRIVAFSPVIGQRVSSPVTVTGTANVHESTVSMRILDAAGKEIATKFTTAACNSGDGCRGEYSTTISYQSCSEQPGTVEIFEVSMEDGSRTHTVSLPVILSACAH